ncbi:hypothetical protein pb186bvf_001881 [Paramecium bursaria]
MTCRNYVKIINISQYEPFLRWVHQLIIVQTYEEQGTQPLFIHIYIKFFKIIIAISDNSFIEGQVQIDPSVQNTQILNLLLLLIQ